MKKNNFSILCACVLALFPLQHAAAQSYPEGISIDTDYSENEPGYYYINLPHLGQSNYTTLDFSQYGDDAIRSFKVYDVAGKNGDTGNYSNTDANLLAIAPQDYIFHITGTVTSNWLNYNYIRFYDGDKEWANRYKYKYKFGNPEGEDVGLLYTKGDRMYINFHAWSAGGAGMDLTVTLVKKSESHNITVNPAAEGGTANASTTSAGATTTVALTATPESGYLPNGFIVKDADGHNIPVDGGWYSSNTASFMMPGTDVTATPLFTNKLSAEDGGLYIIIPHLSKDASDAKVANIPEGIESFKVYDFQPSGVLEQETNGMLLINAPAGKILELTGTVQAETDYAGLRVYDGNTDKNVLGYKNLYGTTQGEVITPLRSSGNQMLLNMYSQYHSKSYKGADLTIRVIDASIKHDIVVNSAAHGSVLASASEAGASEMIDLTVTPEEGYYLNDLIIKDEDGNKIAFDGGVWYSKDKTAHFRMAPGKVSVTPVFTAKEALSINLPVTASSNEPFVPYIPAGVTHFKLYDDGGAEGTPTPGTYAATRLKVPFGRFAHVTGKVEMINNNGYGNRLFFYDSSNTYATNKEYFEQSADVDFSGTSSYLFIVYSQSEVNPQSGLDLTIDFELSGQATLNLSSIDLVNTDVASYMSTCYCKEQSFELPAGFQAFTLNSDYTLSLVGEDGRVIPADCPVVVIGCDSEATLTATQKTATPVAGNILVGVSADTIVGNVYVLSRKYGIYNTPFIGTFSGTVPSGKVYIKK